MHALRAASARCGACSIAQPSASSQWNVPSCVPTSFGPFLLGAGHSDRISKALLKSFSVVR